jgi:hypothetical protein
MNKTSFTLKAFAFLILTCAFATATRAQATRTWVSGVGDDVNPCSRTAPCKTFAGAISKTAAGGEIDALDPGGFGTVTVTKSVTIAGDGTLASILASGTNGVNVNDSATASPNTIVVTLRNLSINGAGTTLGVNGVNFTSGKAVNVENCTIYNFSSNGINVNLTTAPAGSGQELFVKNTSVFNCGTGIRLSQTAAGSFVVGSLNGVKIEHITTNGVRLDSNGFAEIRDSSISLASTAGVSIAASTAQASIIDTMIAHCGTGIAAAGGTSRIAHSTVVLNGTGVAFSGGGTLRTFGDNNFDGNPTPFSGGALTGIGGKQ